MTNEKVSAIASAASVVVATIALVISGIALYQSGRQVDIAKEALRSSERNATWNAYIDLVTSTCNAMDFSGGANDLGYGVYSTGGAIAYYNNNFAVPRETNPALFERMQERFTAMTPVMVRVRTWLAPEEFKFIEQASFDLQRIFQKEVGYYRNVTVPIEAYLKAAVLCLARRDVLINAFQSSDLADAKLPVWDDVKLATRPPRT